MWHQKWAHHTAPFLEPMGAISLAVLKQASMELGSQNWVPQKHKLRPKIGANFWAPLLRPFAHRVMLFQNTLIQRARFKHGRPTWRDRFSNLNQAPFPGLWNHAEVKATSQIAPCVVQKAPLLIRSGKYLICVCEGVVLRQCDLIIRTSVVWR